MLSSHLIHDVVNWRFLRDCYINILSLFSLSSSPATCPAQEIHFTFPNQGTAYGNCLQPSVFRQYDIIPIQFTAQLPSSFIITNCPLCIYKPVQILFSEDLWGLSSETSWLLCWQWRRVKCDMHYAGNKSIAFSWLPVVAETYEDILYSSIKLVTLHGLRFLCTCIKRRNGSMWLSYKHSYF
jgi:hypothetical protein